MHLAIEAVGAKHSGAATVLLAVLDAALGDDRIDRVTLLSSPPQMRRFSLPESPKLVDLPQDQAEGHPLARVAWYERGLNDVVRALTPDVVLCLNGMGVVRDVPQVNFVQQSLPFCGPALQTLSSRNRARIGLIRWCMKRSCRNARAIIVQTPTMARWVDEAFRLGNTPFEVCLPSAALPASEATSEPILDKIKAAPADRRLLYVGNQSPYKNVDVLLRGLTLLRESVPDATLILTWPEDALPHATEGVVCTGQIDRPTLRRVYELSTVLVMPSLVETVGLPMLEAMSLGRCVLAADRPYARDICEDAALFFYPSRPQDFADLAATLLLTPGLRSRYEQRGRERHRELHENGAYRQMVDVVVQATC